MNILDLIFPKRCVSCSRLGRYICNFCKSKIRVPENSICPVCERPAIDGATHPRCRGKYTIDGLTCFFRYDGAVRAAIKAIKYRFAFDIAGELMSNVPQMSHNIMLRQVTGSNKIIIPIPLHVSRLRFRGFNQAEVIAKLLAQKLDFAIYTDILWRTKRTMPQVEMKSRTQRLKNMDDVFTINQHAANRQKKSVSVLLVDDVFTTGATMRAAAKTLKKSRFSFVWGVALAR